MLKSKRFNTAATIILTVLVIITLLPLALIVISSFTKESALIRKAGQADAMTACFSEYSRKVLSKAKSNRVPIREQLKQAADQLSKEKPKQKERAKEVAHEDR